MTHFAISILLGALISIAIFALAVLLGVWTYRDAHNKGMNGFLWTVVVILVPGCIGLLIYLIVRMDYNKVICSNCNERVDGRSRFCANCGMELVPAVETPQDEEAFKRSQRNILIGFFSTVAAIIVLSVFMVAFLIIGGLRLAGDTIKWVSKWSSVDWENTLEETLGGLDVLFDEDELHITIGDDMVVFTDKDGENLIRLDGRKGRMDIDIKGLRSLMDKYGIEYDHSMDDDELRREIEDEFREAIQDAKEAVEDAREDVQDALEDVIEE
ncbi:MAG: zinc ribbon domain-containing protein [Lachnospiraceae bacterium]|nr:zinc ribbon domain-containing protein [Lachnospiraceae bacterium]